MAWVKILTLAIIIVIALLFIGIFNPELLSNMLALFLLSIIIIAIISLIFLYRHSQNRKTECVD